VFVPFIFFRSLPSSCSRGNGHLGWNSIDEKCCWQKKIWKKCMWNVKYCTWNEIKWEICTYHA
jgi:hypothetical protein